MDTCNSYLHYWIYEHAPAGAPCKRYAIYMGESSDITQHDSPRGDYRFIARKSAAEFAEWFAILTHNIHRAGKDDYMITITNIDADSV